MLSVVRLALLLCLWDGITRGTGSGWVYDPPFGYWGIGWSGNICFLWYTLELHYSPGALCYVKGRPGHRDRRLWALNPQLESLDPLRNWRNYLTLWANISMAKLCGLITTMVNAGGYTYGITKKKIWRSVRVWLVEPLIRILAGLLIVFT